MRRIVAKDRKEGGTLEIRDKTPFVARDEQFSRNPFASNTRRRLQTRETRDTPSRSSGPLFPFRNSLKIGTDPFSLSLFLEESLARDFNISSDWDKKLFKGLVKYSQRT